MESTVTDSSVRKDVLTDAPLPGNNVTVRLTSTSSVARVQTTIQVYFIDFPLYIFEPQPVLQVQLYLDCDHRLYPQATTSTNATVQCIRLLNKNDFLFKGINLFKQSMILYNISQP